MKKSGSSTKRMLVVEDEPTICQVCQRVLTGEGFEVDIAVDGMVAQNMIEQKQYDCCLIDVRTPAMNGKELYQWLKDKHPRLADGVIFTTGDVMGGDTQGFLEQTGLPFLPKQFTPDEIKAIVKRTLEQVEQ